MSAYFAASGTVYRRNDIDDAYFVVLDGHIRNFATGEMYRRALVLTTGELTCFNDGSSWDVGSERVM